MHTRLRLRPRDQDEAEPIPFRRGNFQAVREHHPKEVGLKEFKILGTTPTEAKLGIKLKLLLQ